MKLTYTFFIILMISITHGISAEDLPHKEDSIISAINKIRYNYPDSALIITKNYINDATEKEVFYAELLYIKSAIQYIKSNYVESRNSYEELYKVSKELNYDIGIARALNGRGLIYLGRELYEEALNEFEKALEVNTKIENHKNIATNLLNIGICSQELKYWDRAYNALKKSYTLSLNHELELYALMNMNRLGSLFLDNNQLDSAEYYLMKANKSNLNHWEKSYNLSGLSELEIQKGNYNKAVKYGLESYSIAKALGAKWDIAQVAFRLSKAYEGLKANKKALEYHKLYKAYSDSLLNEEMNREINWAELQQTKAENEQLLVQKNLLSSERDRNHLIIALLSTIVLFLIVLAFLYKRHLGQKEKYNQNLGSINKQLAEKKQLIEKQNEDLKQINNAKNRLFSILSHDLRSPINSVKQLLDIRNNISEADSKKFMERLTQEVGNVNKQINRLLKWANTQMDGFKTQPKNVQLDEVVEQNLISIKYIAQEKGIALKHNPAKSFIYIDPEQLNIILMNLLNNSIKYTSKEGSIEIDYAQKEKHVLLSIKDNGVGMDKETLNNLIGEVNERSYSRKGTEMETGTGLGMLLVKQFLTFNHSSIDIESEEGKGTRFILTFPKAKEALS
jgi:signal transduction histidine kinase